MKVFDNYPDLRAWRRTVNGPLGFVPTMGALHDGHLALIEEARKDGGEVVVSIFVNPTQFNDPRDLERYPRPIATDLALLEKAGVSAVFLPRPAEIYADEFRFEMREKAESRILCGATRAGHFEGVLTVVMKLFHLARPTRAYFGEKDYQQFRLIRDMARAFFLEIDVVPVPTRREADGLAMSSRNLLLTPEERERAPALYRILTTADSSAGAKARLEEAGFKVDYVEERWGRRFAAAFLGSVRLIDNVAL